MLRRNLLHKELIQKVGVSLLFGLCGWIGLLVNGAYQFRVNSTDTSFALYAGPFLLNTIARQPDKGSEQISISFERGLIWFFVGLLVVGGIGGLITYYCRLRYAAPS